MPFYNTYQYSMKQYGRFESKVDKRKHKYIFLQSRMLIEINDEKVWIYSTRPTTIKGDINTLRLRDNMGNIIINKQLSFKSNTDKLRLKSNIDKEYIYSERSWG